MPTRALTTCAVLLLLWGSSAPSRCDDEAPHILIVMLDDVGLDMCSPVADDDNEHAPFAFEGMRIGL